MGSWCVIGFPSTAVGAYSSKGLSRKASCMTLSTRSVDLGGQICLFMTTHFEWVRRLMFEGFIWFTIHTYNTRGGRRLLGTLTVCHLVQRSRDRTHPKSWVGKICDHTPALIIDESHQFSSVMSLVSRQASGIELCPLLDGSTGSAGSGDMYRGSAFLATVSPSSAAKRPRSPALLLP